MGERKNVDFSPLQERSKKEKKKRERIKFEGYQRRRDPQEKIDRRAGVVPILAPRLLDPRRGKRKESTAIRMINWYQ